MQSPKYDGPKFHLPPVGIRVQVTGRYLLDVNEGGHSEIHPAYEIIFNPTSPPPSPPPQPVDNAPVANAGQRGPDQTVNEGSLATLDKSASRGS
jgi:hypothetical protein